MMLLPFYLCFLFCFKGKEGKTEAKKTSSKVWCLLLLKGCLFIFDFLIFHYKEKTQKMCLYWMRRKH